MLFFCKVQPYLYFLEYKFQLGPKLGITLNFCHFVMLFFVRYYLTCKVIPYMALYIGFHFIMIFLCKVLPYISVYLDCHFIILFFVRYYLTYKVLPYMDFYIGSHFIMILSCKVIFL